MLRILTAFGEVSGRIIVRIHRPTVSRGTISLTVVIVGLEPRVDHAVRGETSTLLGHPLGWRRRRISALVPSPTVPVLLTSPLLPRETIGLRFRSRALRRETLVLCREGRVHRMYSIVEMRVWAWDMNVWSCSDGKIYFGSILFVRCRNMLSEISIQSF